MVATTTMKPCYVYARVSTDHQGNSLDAQEAKNGDYARLADLEIIETITDEAVSGRTRIDERPGGKRLLNMLAEGKAKDLIVAKIDRLGRNASDILNTVEALLRAGVRPHIVDLRVDCSTPIGKFMIQLLAAVAELEAANIRERISTVMKHRRETGYVVGTLSYGWRIKEGTEADPMLEEHPEQMPILRQMIQWRVERWGYQTIAKVLNERDVPSPTPAGKRVKRHGEWGTTTGYWTNGTVRRALINKYAVKLAADIASTPTAQAA